MPKEKSANPVAAQHKADKKAAFKKSKAQQQSQRNDRLAQRNPDRLQRQIDELKQSDAAGQLRGKEKHHLAHLEKELRGVKKAREVLGDKAPVFRQYRAHEDNAQTQRRAGHGARFDDEPDTEDDARDIPMPEDTPPPVPRRPRPRDETQQTADPNSKGDEPAKRQKVAQTVYTAEPQLRDLGKEARRFVPNSVAANIQKTKPEPGRLVEPEELDRLEQAGYGPKHTVPRQVEMEDMPDEDLP